MNQRLKHLILQLNKMKSKILINKKKKKIKMCKYKKMNKRSNNMRNNMKKTKQMIQINSNHNKMLIS